MGFLAEVRAPFAALLPAINEACEEAGLLGLDPLFGLQRSRGALADAEKLPALAVELRRHLRVGGASGGWHEHQVDVVLSLAHAAATDADAEAQGEAYADLLRAVVEQQVDNRRAGADPAARAFQRLTFLSAEPLGVAFSSDASDATRLVEVRFVVRHWYQEGAA